MVSGLSTGKVVCKTCGEKKVRVKIGKRKTGSIFTDASGKEWLGIKYCPECNVKRSRINMQKLRDKKVVTNEN